MNRRRLLSMISALPLAVLASAQRAESAPAVDPRPTFKRSDFVLVKHGGLRCQSCGVFHGPYYTQGHSAAHPAAFPQAIAGNTWNADKLAPVTDGAIPFDLPGLPDCCLSEWSGPHEHPALPFRWVD